MRLPLPTPDIAGMADSQKRLRALLGRDIRFYGPAEVIYDPSLPPSAFDDEGIPLDPLAGGIVLASAAVDVAGLTVVGSARCDVLFQPLAAMRRDMVAEQQVGWRSRLNKDLIMGIEDRAQVAAATHYMVGTLARDDAGAVIEPQRWTPDDGELWHIVNIKTDGFGGLHRVLIFGQGTR